jgi:hypothetical protein
MKTDLHTAADKFKDKIDPDYFTCNVIESRYIPTVSKD